MSWLDADAYCEEKYESNLATIISDQDLQIALIIKNIQNNDDDHDDVWIGLSDIALLSKENEWVWSDGTLCNYTFTTKCINDKHWDEGEPNDHNGEDCAEISDSNAFNDEDCWINNMFLCNNATYFALYHATTTTTTIITTSTVSPILSTSTTTVVSNNAGLFSDLSTDVFYLLMTFAVIGVFLFLFLISIVDSMWWRINDFYYYPSIITAIIQFQDMLTDIFFIIDVNSNISNHLLELDYLQLTLIFILSMIFVIIPVCLSLWQLYVAIKVNWIKNKNVAHWLGEHSSLLYLVSVITGSSFSAINIFTSYIFQLELFNMSLPRNYLMQFRTNRVYSIVFFENIPQIGLQIWYCFVLGRINLITICTMTFSFISIVVTIFAMCTNIALPLFFFIGFIL